MKRTGSREINLTNLLGFVGNGMGMVWLDIINGRDKGLCCVVLGLENGFGRYYDCVFFEFLWFKVLGFWDGFVEG